MATLLVTLGVAALGVPPTLSTGIWASETVFGLTFFDAYDFATSNLAVAGLRPADQLVRGLCLAGTGIRRGPDQQRQPAAARAGAPAASGLPYGDAFAHHHYFAARPEGILSESKWEEALRAPPESRSGGSLLKAGQGQSRSVRVGRGRNVAGQGFARQLADAFFVELLAVEKFADFFMPGVSQTAQGGRVHEVRRQLGQSPGGHAPADHVVVLQAFAQPGPRARAEFGPGLGQTADGPVTRASQQAVVAVIVVPAQVDEIETSTR